MSTAFENRLRKRYRHLRKFAKRWPTEAFRVYDRDIPEFAWTVDVYGEHVYVQNIKGKGGEDQADDVIASVADVIGVDPEMIHYNERRRRSKTDQYERADEKGDDFLVTEGGLKFWVNLDTYVDTGLFLDHRNMRRMVADEIASLRESLERAPRMLNLFAYTGAFSVWAAREGARVTTVDMSNTYIDWTKRNFDVNRLPTGKHRFERADIMKWLPRLRPHDNFDVIVLDPPTFSKSKKMEGTLDVQRDHPFLINTSLRHLNRGGTLYFSTNLRSFTLEEEKLDAVTVEEITPLTMSEDFRTGIHRAFLIR